MNSLINAKCYQQGAVSIIFLWAGKTSGKSFLDINEHHSMICSLRPL